MKLRMFLYLSILAILTASCKSTEQLIIHDTIRNERVVKNIRIDSVFVHDSVMVKESGDTIYVDRWHTMYKEVVDVHHDTIRDTIHTNTQAVSPVKERHVHWWERWLVGGFVLIVLMFALKLMLNSEKLH